MHKRIATAVVMAVCLVTTGCGQKNDEFRPMMGLEWFITCEKAKTELDDYTLLAERQRDDLTVPQKMLDYSGASLYDLDCDVTLCFTENGLVGLNYHDTERAMDFRRWFDQLEKDYGLPTEEGTGMASWYDDPLGKNTAIYLFNLKEGVQVSYYATADSPDRTYAKQSVSPELRTPIVAYEGADSREVPAADSSVHADASAAADSSSSDDLRAGEVSSVNSAQPNAEPQITSSAPNDADVHEKNSSDGDISVSSRDIKTPDAYLLNGLKFYGAPDEMRKLMTGYTFKNEYRNNVAGQPWELIMEYENVGFMDRNCDAVLCFTSLGLVGINYFDHSGGLSYWGEIFSAFYGTPDQSANDRIAWTNSPIGKGTMIYIFDSYDGVQISFFADDTGSEPA